MTDRINTKYGAHVPVKWRGEVVPEDKTYMFNQLSPESRRLVEQLAGEETRDEFIDPHFRVRRRLAKMEEDEGRYDLRHEGSSTYLIDERAKRPEDAVTVVRDEVADDGSGILKFHTVDIPYLVPTGTQLDHEAAAYGKTTYGPEGRHLMFPEELADNIFCLDQRKEMPAITVEFHVDADQKVVEKDIYRSIINPHEQYSFEEAKALVGKSARKEADYRSTIKDLELLQNVAVRMAMEETELEQIGSMSITMEVLQNAVNRHCTDVLMTEGQGIFRNQGYWVGEWTGFAENYLQSLGIEAEGVLSKAEDPIRELGRIRWKQGAEGGGEHTLKELKALWDDAVFHERPKTVTAYDVADEDRNDAAQYSPVPFGHEKLELPAVARFTSPSSHYDAIVNWRVVLGEQPAPRTLQSIADNLNAAER